MFNKILLVSSTGGGSTGGGSTGGGSTGGGSTGGGSTGGGFPLKAILIAFLGANFLADIFGGVIVDIWKAHWQNQYESFSNNQEIKLTNNNNSSGLIAFPSHKSYEIYQFISCDLKTKETFKEIKLEFIFDRDTEIDKEGIFFIPKTINSSGFDRKNDGNKNIRYIKITKKISPQEKVIFSFLTKREIEEYADISALFEKPIIHIEGKKVNDDIITNTILNCE